MSRELFDKDVRAGFAHVLDTITGGICELWGVDEEKLKEYSAGELEKLPVGAEALFALIYSITAFLLEQDDGFAIDLLAEAAQGIEPAVLRHMGIQNVPINRLLREDSEWN